MITDLLFYTISAIQGLFAFVILLLISGIWKLLFNGSAYENADKGFRSAWYLLFVVIFVLILITTVKPYLLVMIGGMA
jgi:hypothetical protein